MEKRRTKKSDNRLKLLDNEDIEYLLKWSKDKEKDKILQILLEQQNKINEIIKYLNKG